MIEQVRMGRKTFSESDSAAERVRENDGVLAFRLHPP